MPSNGTTTEATLRVYEATAHSYVDRTTGVDMSEEQEFFLERLPRVVDARVLDAGCGSGRDALAFARRGLAVEAFDGSAVMASLAAKTLGSPVHVLRFDQVVWENRFDGIWACASLLHLDDAGLEAALKRLYRALRPGGILCAVMKVGQGSEAAADGRFYRYTDIEDLSAQMQKAGLHSLEWRTATSHLRSDSTMWLTMAGRR